MQHKRSRLTTKILAFVLILALVFPASAFASVADVAKDTRAPGKSLANTYPAYTDIDWQISLAENAQAEVTVPTNMTAEELGTAMNGGLTLSLDRDSTRGYLDPEKFPSEAVDRHQLLLRQPLRQRGFQRSAQQRRCVSGSVRLLYPECDRR